MHNTLKNILIVEDEVISALYLVNILHNLGFKHTFTACDAEEALEIIQENQIDLVFMDINIEGAIDGITCAHLLNEKYFIPIIYTTAYRDTNTIVNASDTNIFGFLIKPFDRSNVESTLYVALKKRNQAKKIIKNDILDLGKGQKFNFINNTFSINNIAIHLTKNELNTLSLLCKNLNQNISYDVLKEHVWKEKDISDSNIRDTISRLKKKTPNLNIENIINLGYILKLKCNY